jgi:F-type H+-transporting ATPase subunit delta
MVTGSLARRWAKALFAIGEEQGNLLGLTREVQRVAETWEESEELRNAMSNPAVGHEARTQVWESLQRRLGVTRIGRNFFMLLLTKGRLAELPAIARELQVLGDRKDNRLRAEVSSAAAIGEDVVTRLRMALQKATGSSITVNTSVEPGLIGGLVTRIGDMMYDGSVKTQLARAKEQMLGHGR